MGSNRCRGIRDKFSWLVSSFFFTNFRPSALIDRSISFQYLYLHADKSVLLDEEPRCIISRALMDFPTLLHIKRAVHLILHGLNSTASQDALVLLLTKIMEDVSGVLSVNDINALKEYIFAQDGNLKSLCITQDIADSTRDGKLFFASRLLI